MKASDYARTASEREDAGAQLIRTEQTNAVNTGIVGSADKSAMALKRAAYEKGRRSSAGGAAAAAAAGKRAKAGKEAAGSGGESGSTFGKEQAASQKTRTQADHHLRESLKKAAKPAARDALIGGVVSKTLEDSELEGMDDAAYRGRRAVRIARRLHRHFSGRDALEKEAPLGALCEKKYRKKPADAAEVQRKAQAAGYLRREMYTATDATQKAAASAGGSAVKRALPAAAGTQGKGLVALLGGSAVPAIFGLLLAVVLVAVLADKDVDGCLTAIGDDVRHARQWYAVLRVLIDGGLWAEGGYDSFCQHLATLLPDHGHLPASKELSRMAVFSFAKSVYLWDENNAPVSGARFRDYKAIALRMQELLATARKPLNNNR